MSSSNGPFVAMAVLCQRIDRQPDGTVDVLGIVDGLGISVTEGEDLRADPAKITLTALVALRAGQWRGPFTVRVQGHFPSGLPGPSVSSRVFFTEDAPGATLTVPLDLEVQEGGVYRFDVSGEEGRLTEIALHVHVVVEKQ
jgi:hypothetical protein